MNVDVIFHGGFVITMEGPGTGIIENGAVAVKGNRIAAVGPTADVLREYRAERYIDTAGKAVMPGFVDSHIHTGDVIVRSCAQDIPGDVWRIHGILPLLGAAREEDYIIGSRLNIIEALKAGTTTFGDFYSPMSSIVQNYIDLGARACVSDMINEMPKDTIHLSQDELLPLDSAIGNRKLESNIKLLEEYHQSHDGRITCRFGMHTVEYCTVELLREIKAQADKYQVGINTHLSQSNGENKQCMMRNGCRPAELLDRLGYLGPSLTAAHLTCATQEEVRRVAESGTVMVLCMGSNMLVDGSLPPARQFADCGGTVALATDQANNCSFMFGEMKCAALFTKHATQDATQMPAWKVLRMATIEGAKALTMEDQIGSLCPGKLADIILIDLSYPHLNPIYTSPIRNLIPNLVYSARGHEVELVMVNGQIIVENHVLLTEKEEDVIQKANEAAGRISRDLAQHDWAAGLPLAKLTSEGSY